MRDAHPLGKLHGAPHEEFAAQCEQGETSEQEQELRHADRRATRPTS